MLVRVVLNILYLVGIIYLQLANEISKAPYALALGYYLNIVAPVIYIIFAAASGTIFHET